jgi:hypothetical protein
VRAPERWSACAWVSRIQSTEHGVDDRSPLGFKKIFNLERTIHQIEAEYTEAVAVAVEPPKK